MFASSRQLARLNETRPDHLTIKTSTAFRDATLLVAAAASTASAAPIARRADISACKLQANSSASYSPGFGTATESSPQELYDYFFPDATKWFDASSYGKLSLNITADTTRFLRMPKPAPEYPFERGPDGGAAPGLRQGCP